MKCLMKSIIKLNEQIMAFGFRL